MKRLTALAMVCMLVWLGASVVSADEPCTTFGSGYAVADQSSEVLEIVPEDSGFKIDVPLGPVALPSAMSDGVMLAADGETTIVVPNSSTWSYRDLNGYATLNSSSGFFSKTNGYISVSGYQSGGTYYSMQFWSQGNSNMSLAADGVYWLRFLVKHPYIDDVNQIEVRFASGSSGDYYWTKIAKDGSDGNFAPCTIEGYEDYYEVWAPLVNGDYSSEDDNEAVLSVASLLSFRFDYSSLSNLPYFDSLGYYIRSIEFGDFRFYDNGTWPGSHPDLDGNYGGSDPDDPDDPYGEFRPLVDYYEGTGTGAANGEGAQSVDAVASDLSNKVSQIETFEDSIGLMIDEQVGGLDPSQLQMPTNILSGVHWIGHTFMSAYDNLGEFQYIVLFPMFVGLALLFIGRGERAVNMHVSRARYRSKDGD